MNAIIIVKKFIKYQRVFYYILEISMCLKFILVKSINILLFCFRKNKKQSKPKKAVSSIGLETVSDLSMDSMVID
jgi:hypothetical protein